MTCHRFFVAFVPPTSELQITDQRLCHHMNDVLHLVVGEAITVFDGSTERRGILREITRQVVRVQLGIIVVIPPPLVNVTLAVSLLKGDGWDDMVRHGTEVGVYSFQPLICQRSVVSKLSAHKRQRYELIAREAAEQSGRQQVPLILEAQDFTHWIQTQTPTNTFIAHMTGMPVSGMLAQSTLSVVVGPEGGWSDQELQTARSLTIPVIQAGQTVLTARFAPLAFASFLLFRV